MRHKGGAPDVFCGELKGVAKSVTNGMQNADSLVGDLGADAIARQYGSV